MKAHYLQHVPFEGIGSIKNWLEASGYRITCTKLYETPCFPDPRSIDVLIIMGGPMSVNDEHHFSWLVAEKKFIHEVIHAEKPVLGICLGAQLIANVLGARVYRNPVKEIGWFPVQGIPSGEPFVFKFPGSIEVFHWHGETFDLPARAVHLAKSEGCFNQAFQFGKSVIGLQFHLETTPEAARDLVFNFRDELITAPYIQTEEEILSVNSDKYQIINNQLINILSFLTSNSHEQSRR